MLKQILNPDLYHGFNKKGNFFEGWYFKIVSHDNMVFSFIPGVSISKNPEHTFSFIQVFYGNKSKVSFVKYPYEAFDASKNSFDIHVSHNRFTLNSMNLAINQNSNVIKGYLKFKYLKKWPDSLLNPGSMGFYNYLTFMECYSQVCALTGDIDGVLSVNGVQHDFTGGKLYIEKNWGKAFPYSYIWAQCNNFKNSDTSLSCSIGHVPMLTGSFTGFLIGLYSQDEFYKFTTTNKSRLSVSFKDRTLYIKVKNRHQELSIDCLYDKDKFALLYAPKEGSMIPIADETLQGTVHLQLEDLRTQSLILQESGKCAGIEFSGDYKHLCNTSI